jgi:hypothetical protein
MYTEVFTKECVKVYIKACKVRSTNIQDVERVVEDCREERRNKREQVGLQARRSSKEATAKKVGKVELYSIYWWKRPRKIAKKLSAGNCRARVVEDKSQIGDRRRTFKL